MFLRLSICLRIRSVSKTMTILILYLSNTEDSEVKEVQDADANLAAAVDKHGVSQATADHLSLYFNILRL